MSQKPDPQNDAYQGATSVNACMKGQVVKLDRGYPLIKDETGHTYRCEHATALVKGEQVRAVIGDNVLVSLPDSHEKAILEEILPRENELVRKDPTERAVAQVLAANFDQIFVVQPISDLNMKRLERELVLAHETGARVIVLLTKADLAESVDEIESIRHEVQKLIGEDTLLIMSADHLPSIEEVRKEFPEGTISILLGKSGVGKSSLINLLSGEEVQQTAEVRETDGRGRHTTVSREMIKLPEGGYVIDMPGVRGLGLWDADDGIEQAFSDIEEYAATCKFRDCGHGSEPGCAVRAAVERGDLAPARLASYHSLKQESKDIKTRREEAERIRIRTGHPRRRT